MSSSDNMPMQDPEVAVIKTQLAHLQEGVSGLRDAMGAMNAKFDLISGLMHEQVRLQEQQRASVDGITRAHARVDALEATVTTAVADRDEWRAAHARDHSQIDRQVNVWRGWVMGIGGAGTMLLALALWVANGLIVKLNDVSAHVQTNEVELLKHKLEEAQKRSPL